MSTFSVSDAKMGKINKADLKSITEKEEGRDVYRESWRRLNQILGNISSGISRATMKKNIIWIIKSTKKKIFQQEIYTY